jgi:hypothetical protein
MRFSIVPEFTSEWARIGRASRLPLGSVAESVDADAAMRTLATVLAAGGLLLGILAGYVLWGHRSRDLEGQLKAVQGREAAEKQRADDLRSRVAEIEAQVKRLTDDLTAERDLRHKYEGLVGRGRK